MTAGMLKGLSAAFATTLLFVVAAMWTAGSASAKTVAHPVGHPTPTPMPMGQGCGTNHLAQTGITTGALLLIAAGLLLCGTGAMRLGRRCATPA